MRASPTLSVPDREHHTNALDPASARILAESLVPFSGGRRVEEIAEGLQVSVSLEEAVDRGWISAAERRLFEHRATREDLEELGCPPDDIETILRDQ